MSDVLDLLLRSDVPDVQAKLPTCRCKVNRLSELVGKDVVFTLQALPYGRVQDIRELSRDSEVAILLAGCVEPDLKNEELLKKFGAPTPAELVKKMLLPGEVADLSMEVERLSGYRRTTIETLKNGSGTAATES